MNNYDLYKHNKHSHQTLKNQQYINGFTLIENYLIPEEEQNLITQINNQKWVVDYQRRLQYYNYRNELIKPYALIPIPNPIPDFLNKIIDKMINDKIITNRPDQIIINEYKPGDGLKPHFDRKDYFSNEIVGVSLGSTTTLEFSNGSDKSNVFLPRRSLYILKDDARYLWKHGIVPKKYDVVNGIKVTRQTRISITFRNVIKEKVKTKNIVIPESKI